MKKYLLAATVAATTALAAVPAMAGGNPTIAYGDVGPWHIGIDQSMGNGCYADAIYGAVNVRIGFDVNSDAGFLSVTSIRGFGGAMVEGRPYYYYWQLDNGPVMKWWATATITSAGYPSVIFRTKDPSFLSALAAGNTLHMWSEYGQLANIQLTATYSALHAVADCQFGNRPNT